MNANENAPATLEVGQVYYFRRVEEVVAPPASPTLAPASLTRFLEYAEDAPNWSGEPLMGGNVGGDKADKGHVLNMKKAGLVTTFRDEGCTWILFTEAGKALAAQHGYKV